MSEIYGLDYDKAFLDSLPTAGHPVNNASSLPSSINAGEMMSSRLAPAIHTLTVSQFKDLHYQHILSHPPDSVLFPFLHGIEGDNEAQNLFFATQGQQAVVYNRRNDNEQPIHPQVNRARVPKYRGMMWVICEDDLENPDKDLRILVHRPSNLSSYASSEHYDDSSDSYFDDEDELDDNFDDSSSDSFGELMSPDSTATYTKEPVVRPVSASQMDLDIQYNDGGDDVDDLHHNPGVVEIVEIGADDKHMHPVQHRALHPLPTPIRTTDLPNSHHSKSPTTTTTTASGFSSSPLTDNGTEPSTALTEPESDDRCHSLPPSHEQTERHSSPRILGSRHHKHTSSSSRKTPPPPPPPILTSTFRASDLLRPVCGSETSSHSKPHEYTRSGANHAAGGAQTEADCANDQKKLSQEDDDGEWEFVPLHVPEGISLRNFGIQVPILASVSDIIIYSPNATGAAQSANALRLARRFKQAVERKRRERVGCKADNAVTAAPSDTSAAHSTESSGASNDSNTPLDYNVFLLDANADEIKREMPHLVVKLCPEGEVPGSLGAALAGPSKSNHVSLFHHDEDGDVVMAENCDASISDHPVSNTSTRVKTVPNTVDFAQREKDEMRDLTRASEIVSMFPEGHTLAYLNPDPLHPPVYVQPSSHQIPTSNGDEVDLSNTKTFWNPHVGQVYLGNANDVPLPVNGMGEFGELDPRWDGHDSVEKDVYPPGNSPRHGYGYDICIECHDLAPFPTLAHLKASEEKVAALEQRWKDQVELSRKEKGETQANYSLPPRPPPHPNAIIHLPMPSSPPITAGTMSALMPVVRFLQKCIVPTDAVEIVNEPPISPATETSLQNGSAEPLAENMKSRRWSSVSSLIPSFPGFPMHSNNPPPQPSLSPSSSTTSTSRHRSMTSPAPPAHLRQRSQTSSMHSRHTSLSYLASSSNASPFPWSRPLKILLYSADGYTESSVPALCLLMAMKGLSLPHAYLELQVAKRRSFFVYHADLGVLRKVESFVDDERRTWKEEIQKEEKRLRLERERMERLKNSKDQRAGEVSLSLFGGSTGALGFDFPTHMNPYRTWGSGDSSSNSLSDSSRLPLQPNRMRPMAKSVSFTRSPFIASPKGGGDSSMGTVTAIPTQQDLASRSVGTGGLKGSATLPMSSSAPSSSMTSLDGIGETSSVSAAVRTRRPRASTSPWLPSLFGGDHQSWFNDPRFDGSFPSRVLPFLYLGNLAHASNVYMLQALGITHVVSVGECALVPPDSHNARGHGSSGNNSQGSGHFIPSKSSAHQGSLWIEERAGRIKVLDIQGVCDDGIDTLEPQLEPICDWIDQARQEGGQVLVHCRVGVSRSATVTIAYVMKHLSLPLVDAYLIVRSRRLSVLIQPNMRLLYNLLGWEIKLAKDRAGSDDEKLRKELSCALSWPFLAKEVHALNEKYLR